MSAVILRLLLQEGPDCERPGVRAFSLSSWYYRGDLLGPSEELSCCPIDFPYVGQVCGHARPKPPTGYAGHCAFRLTLVPDPCLGCNLSAAISC